MEAVNRKLIRPSLNEIKEQIAPPRLVTGKDLIGLGYTPGPDFGRTLGQIEDAQLDGRVKTKEEALTLVKELMPPTSEQPST